MNETPQKAARLLLEGSDAARLLSEYDKLTRHCAADRG
jgi:hypothetical protein